MKKIIIWLFEKYCFNDWVDQQVKLHKLDTMVKNGIKTEEELDEYYSDLHNRPLEEAYYVGKEDGYNKAMQENFSL